MVYPTWTLPCIAETTQDGYGQLWGGFPELALALHAPVAVSETHSQRAADVLTFDDFYLLLVFHDASIFSTRPSGQKTNIHCYYSFPSMASKT